MTLQISLIICFYYVIGWAYLRKDLPEVMRETTDRSPASLFAGTFFVLTAWPYIMLHGEIAFVKTFIKLRRMYVAEVWFNTDHEGNWVPEDQERPVAYFGPFLTSESGVAWLEKYFNDDKDVYRDQVIRFNRHHARSYINNASLIERHEE